MRKRGFFDGLFGKKEENEPPSTDESEMIQGIKELGDMKVKEVLVPRIDTVFLPTSIAWKDLMHTMVESGHSRYPVYRESIDNVVGVLYLKDVVRHLNEFPMAPDTLLDLATLCRSAYFVPDSKRLDSLLADFKRKRVHICVALDEYGGVAGIVCMEDVIEIIIGDIQDEFDNEVEDLIELGANTWLCDARVSIEDLNEKVGLDLPHENFDTLGGFVFDIFGKIPVRFEKVSKDDVEYIVQGMEGHKIKTIKLVKLGSGHD